MEAIFQHGGHQYKAKEGMTIDIEFSGAEPGASVEFAEVLSLALEGSEPRVGTPLVVGAKVVGKVVGSIKGPKLIAASFRRRKDSRRRVGHRQKYTQVRIEAVCVDAAGG
jgi:large subunit ribosomal protein L21